MPLLWTDQLNSLIQFRSTTFDQFPQKLTTIPKNKRLGKLAECLFADWVSCTPNLKICLENHQIIEDKRTIGELDVIIKNSVSGDYFHIELVTKFYVYQPEFDVDTIDAWIGPNRNDSLKNKIEKLQQKQLPLLHHPITVDYLNTLGLSPEEIKQRVCFKAWLFVPLDFDKTLKLFNNECIAGHYLTFNKFLSLHTSKTTYFCPQKQDWLRFPETQKEWFLLDETIPQIQEFMKAQQAIMVWTQYEGQYKRYIIVPYQQF
ncbi:DUF1853 family protein [Aquimarina agarilytica]|uniref:DUF1853 family protein n=1 Tax=Aquimarina agarilytica TaxID=1087449 RepID=UPI0002885D47|nr:DUF1853 family protein [Aquimarina agarilytica]